MADRYTRGLSVKRHKGVRVGTLWCAHCDVDGDVTLSLDFDDMTDVARMDLLTDFIGLLEMERDVLRGEMFLKRLNQNETA